MKQTVHFSKTEKLPNGMWECTVSPASIRKGYEPRIGDTISDEEFVGIVNISPIGSTLIVANMKGIPCVGREYKIERK